MADGAELPIELQSKQQQFQPGLEPERQQFEPVHEPERQLRPDRHGQQQRSNGVFGLKLV